MIALESRLEQRLAGLVAEMTGYLEAPAVVGELHALVTKQHEALNTHVPVLDHPDVSFTGSALSAAFEAPPESQLGKRGPETLASLRALATAFTQIAFGSCPGQLGSFRTA